MSRKVKLLETRKRLEWVLPLVRQAFLEGLAKGYSAGKMGLGKPDPKTLDELFRRSRAGGKLAAILTRFPS